MKKELAEFAGKHFSQTNTAESTIAAASVKAAGGLKITAIRKLPLQPVYNMEVDVYHNFAVNGGLIVHNCMDSARYFVRTKRLIKRHGEPEYKPIWN